MTNTPDYDLAPYLARGRTLRSQAFLAAFRSIRNWIKGAAVVKTPASASAQNC